MWWIYCVFSHLAWNQSLGGTLSQGTPVSRFSNMVGYCWNHCLDVHDWCQSQLKSVLTGSMKGPVTRLPVLSCAQFNTGTLSWIWHVARCHIVLEYKKQINICCVRVGMVLLEITRHCIGYCFGKMWMGTAEQLNVALFCLTSW